MHYYIAIMVCMYAVHMFYGIGFSVSLISCMCVYISVIVVLISAQSVYLYVCMDVCIPEIYFHWLMLVRFHVAIVCHRPKISHR